MKVTERLEKLRKINFQKIGKREDRGKKDKREEKKKKKGK